MSTATFTNLGMDSDKTRSALKGANAENFNIVVNGRMMRAPMRHIYVYSVAKRGFNVTRTLFPHLNLIGCENGERCVTSAIIADPIVQASPDQERGGTRTDEHSAWRAAIDLLNPTNLTENPYTGDQNPDFYANKSGTNLIAEGLWCSLNEIPEDDEIKKAEKARDRHYQWLTREAGRLAAVSTKDLNEFLQQYPDTHTAMDALGLEATWHARNLVKAFCPNCGDEIKSGLAFHKSSAGMLCVIDAARAYKAGAIDKAKYEELSDSTGIDENGDAVIVEPKRKVRG